MAEAKEACSKFGEKTPILRRTGAEGFICYTKDKMREYNKFWCGGRRRGYKSEMNGILFEGGHAMSPTYVKSIKGSCTDKWEAFKADGRICERFPKVCRCGGRGNLRLSRERVFGYFRFHAAWEKCG